MPLWNNPITRGVAATGLRVAGAGLDLIGADRSAQGTYRQASNITNPNVGINSGITLSNGLPLVEEFRSNGGLPTRVASDRSGTQNNDNSSDDSGNGRNSGNFVQDTSAAQTAQERASALLGIDLGLNSANDALGRLDRQYQVGEGNIGREFQDAAGRLMGQRQIVERNYNQNRTGQINEYQSARNMNNQQASSWLDGARRTLGTQGAGGGSAARYALPFEANTQASAANAQDQSTATRNLTSLDQNWQDDQDEFRNAEADLNRQRDQGIGDLRSRIEGQRADLLNTVGTLSGQKAIAQGGDYNAALAASQPYTSRISAILNQIDGLSATPNIRERAVTLNAPDLARFDFARPEAAPVAQQDPSLTNPLLALFGLQDERQV